MPYDPNLYLLPWKTSNGDPQLAWSDLKFNPVGLYNLRKLLGIFPNQPGVFKKYQQEFMASDLAWFAAGASEDSAHHIQANTFHPLFRTSRENTPTGPAGNKLRTGVRQHVRQLTFDLATTWDRAYGGSTLIIHVDGATVPGVPSLPEYLKADVYLPPHLVEEHPDCHRTVAAIVQAYIEDIGVRTVDRYVAAGQNIGWSFTFGRTAIPPNFDNLPIFPAPVKQGSAHYIFRGRPYGSLALLASPSNQSAAVHSLSSTRTTPNPMSTPATLASSQSDAYIMEEPDAFDLEMIDATEKIANLKIQLEEAGLKEDAYLSEIESLRNELTDIHSTLRKQECVLEDLGISISEYDSESTTAPLNSPASFHHALPHMSPNSPKGKQRVNGTLSSPTPSTPLKYPRLDISSSQIPYPIYSSSSGQADSNIHSNHLFPQTPRARSKPNREPAMSVLGPATVAFISHHNLMYLAQFLTLVIKNNSPTRWSTMLDVLSLSDDLRDGLLGALTIDLEAGVFET